MCPGHSRINADPHRIVHHDIGIDQRNRDPVIAVFLQIIKTGMPGDISGEQIAGLNFVFFQIGGKGVAVKAATGLSMQAPPPASRS